MENFIVKKVDLSDADLMEHIYRLRLQVYARECGFINEADYPNGLEIDEYDHQSLHFAAIDAEGDVIGTTRMILTDRCLAPIEKYCPHLPAQKNLIPGKFTEISRMVVSKELRRRKRDTLGLNEPLEGSDAENGLVRQASIAFALYREAYFECLRRDITHWCALMEKSLWLLLKIYGFKFECIGDEVNVFGQVRPYLGRVDDVKYTKAFQDKPFTKRMLFFNKASTRKKAGLDMDETPPLFLGNITKTDYFETNEEKLQSS